MVGEKLGLEIDPYPALWKRYGNAAGPIRNKQMIEEGKPDYALAFHKRIEDSIGTVNMINQLRQYGIPYDLFED